MRNTKYFLFLSFVAVLFSSSCIELVDAATYGVDVSTLTSVAAFQCLKASTPTAYTHVIVRAWKRTTGEPDTNCPQTVANAYAGGMTNVDVYFYPCFTCGNVATQVQTCYDYLKNNSVVYRTFWLDVEGTWSNSTSTNQVFFEQMLSKSVSLGLTVGIYSSQYMWTTIMGTTYTGGSAYPLWYPRYDNISSFSGFTAFGGWSTPIMKQYQQTTPICGASVDFNYAINYPLPSVTPTPSRTPSPTPSRTPSPTPSRTPSPSVTPSAAPFSAWTWEPNVNSARAGAKVTKCLINGDSYLDLVVTGVNNVYVFLGTASGTYPSTPSYSILINSAPAATTDGLGLECADVNKDGYADVLVGNWTATPSYVHIFNGTSSGLSTTPANLIYNTGSGHYYGAALISADFNKDGKVDLAVGAYGLGRVFIHWGLGSAGLNTTRDAPSLLYPNIFTYGQNLAVCDVANDGYPELLVGARSQNGAKGQMYIYPNSAGVFQTSINRIGAANNSYFAYDIGCGDINGDGNKDVAVLSQGTKLLSVYYGTGSVSTFPASAAVTLSLVDGARAIAVGDQNLDSYADLIVGHNAANKIQIWRGGSGLTSASTPSFTYTGPAGNSGWSVALIGNLDGRGRAEIAFGAYTYGSTQTNEGLAGVLYNS